LKDKRSDIEKKCLPYELTPRNKDDLLKKFQYLIDEASNGGLEKSKVLEPDIKSTVIVSTIKEEDDRTVHRNYEKGIKEPDDRENSDGLEDASYKDDWLRPRKGSNEDKETIVKTEHVEELPATKLPVVLSKDIATSTEYMSRLRMKRKKLSLLSERNDGDIPGYLWGRTYLDCPAFTADKETETDGCWNELKGKDGLSIIGDSYISSEEE